MAETPSTPGWVYIFTNESMPGLVKIGLTTGKPVARAKQLTAATGVPLPFVVAWQRAVKDCRYVEGVVHRMLDDKRVRGKVAAGAKQEAEFFRIDVKTARQVIEAGADSMLGARHARPWRQRTGPGPLRRNGRRKGRRRRGHDLTGFGLLAAGVVLVAVLLLFRPPLGWLPAPVGQAFAAIERLGG